ncbi:MAG: hypothetical protein KKF44_05230 [Nanoarchaeota archaeon]|nr:hypothetical protein [Nanoarchaeota archaeon]
MPENKPDIEGLKNYLEEYIKSLETIMAAEGLLDPVKQRSIMDYMELDNYNLNSKRYITTDEIIAVLPEECNSADRDLAQRITYLTTQRIKNIKEAHQEFKDIDPIPIPIVFYNSTEEVSKVARKPKYAGVMSLQNGPLFNTFNLEAAFGLENAMAELEMVNPSLSSHKNDIAEKLMLYSALHETTHTLVERLRLRYCLDKGISMEQYVK